MFFVNKINTNICNFSRVKKKSNDHAVIYDMEYGLVEYGVWKERIPCQLMCIRLHFIRFNINPTDDKKKRAWARKCDHTCINFTITKINTFKGIIMITFSAEFN